MLARIAQHVRWCPWPPKLRLRSINLSHTDREPWIPILAAVQRGHRRKVRVAPFLTRLRSRVARLYFFLAQPMTLGVRGVVIDESDRVLLVRHGYISGWHFPGGGVEAGETVPDALSRELEEEARVALRGEPVLHGLFFNMRESRRDHIAVYVIREFAVLGERASDWEIREARFFSRSALPEGTTAATRARLIEIFDSAPLTDLW
jgi:ADP-ribose pyrophosphatase YjhB (NUDIX family)